METDIYTQKLNYEIELRARAEARARARKRIMQDVYYILSTEELMMRAKAVIEGMQKGWLKLRIDQALPLEKAAEAHQKLEERKTTGKVLLIP